MKNELKRSAVIKESKTARGYRLKQETHILISKIQKILGSDQDAAIARACSMYYKKLSKGKKTNKY